VADGDEWEARAATPRTWRAAGLGAVQAYGLCRLMSCAGLRVVQA
jgi:hypothetical protein